MLYENITMKYFFEYIYHVILIKYFIADTVFL